MSEWRERANRRRDERHTALPCIRPPSSSKRDTKKWCRGKVGAEHRPICVGYNALKNVTYAPDWKVLLCTECGKHLNYWMPCPWSETKEPTPSWASGTPALSISE